MTLSPWEQEVADRGELYHVGGAVRDALFPRGKAPEDKDYLVRGLEPKALVDILEKYGRVERVGQSFGVYTFRPLGESVDHHIAFPRTERSTGPGHRDFDAAFDPALPVEVDLARRDFTMNAVARNLVTGELVDPFDGRADIRRRRLRMIFPEAFEEDPLRILRGVRFTARFRLTVEKKTLAAMAASAARVSTLAPERIQEELNKLLRECATPSSGFAFLDDLGVLAIIMPELSCARGVEQNDFHPDDVFWHSLKSCDAAPSDNLLVRWAALLHDLGKVDKKQVLREPGRPPRVVFYGHETRSAELAGVILNRLRFPKGFVKACVHLVLHHMFFYEPEWKRRAVRRFIRDVGVDHVDDLFALRRADLRSRKGADQAEAADRRKPPPPIVPSGSAAEFPELDELRSRIQEEIDAAHAFRVEDLAIDGRDVIDVLGVQEGRRVGEILDGLFRRVLDAPELNTREKLIALLRREGGGRDDGAPG